jgi:DNA-binding ferritin-like protein
MEAFDRLKKLVLDTEEDLKKAEGGNKAAGTRVRGLMQDIKAVSQEIREKILEIRDAGDSK